MTDQPEIPGAEDALKPTDLPFDNSTEKTEKPAPKKRAAKKAAAPPEPPKAEKDGGFYLPALPEGYAYVRVEIVGPTDDDRLTLFVDEGKTQLSIAADQLERSIEYDTFGAGIKGAAQGAKNLVKRAARKAELAALEAEFGE